jgi:hypothetical protein
MSLAEERRSHEGGRRSLDASDAQNGFDLIVTRFWTILALLTIGIVITISLRAAEPLQIARSYGRVSPINRRQRLGRS